MPIIGGTTEGTCYDPMSNLFIPDIPVLYLVYIAQRYRT